jgi:hypothetical protein
MSPGMFNSEKTRSTGTPATSTNCASSASEDSITEKPPCSKQSASVVRRWGSSSTTRMSAGAPEPLAPVREASEALVGIGSSEDAPPSSQRSRREWDAPLSKGTQPPRAGARSGCDHRAGLSPQQRAKHDCGRYDRSSHDNSRNEPTELWHCLLPDHSLAKQPNSRTVPARNRPLPQSSTPQRARDARQRLPNHPLSTVRRLRACTHKIWDCPFSRVKRTSGDDPGMSPFWVQHLT